MKKENINTITLTICTPINHKIGYVLMGNWRKCVKAISQKQSNLSYEQLCKKEGYQY
jgi:hypothetical protein